jgi:hypothetical protein
VVPGLLAAGFVFGLALANGGALIGAIVVGIAVVLTSEVEVSPVFLGVGYSLVSAFAIAMGVALWRAFNGRVT